MKKDKSIVDKKLNQLDYKFLAENSYEIFWKMDLRLRFTYVSSSILENTGYTVEEWITSRLSNHITQSEFIKIARVILTAINNCTNSKSVRSKLTVLSKNGVPINYEVIFKVKCADDGIPFELMGGFRDISKNTQEEINLKRSFSLKNKLMLTIIHDIKGSFASTVGFGNLLIEHLDEINGEQARKIAVLLRENIIQTHNFLNNLLEWSRSHTDEFCYAPTRINFKNLVDEIKELLSFQSEYKAVRIDNEVKSDIVIMADFGMIRTVVFNLVINAIKYSYQNERIIIRCSKEKDSLKCFITDFGVGMDIDKIKKLFGLKMTASTTGTNNEQGTGLGLFLCKEFIERHKGEIGVYSEKGVGSTFWFTIPI
ncbi:MAG: PAS domain-containing sensor histidine kinase [Carboxylicivirga sp.]|jgi:PAS domain S-box-containing protein|nr:PAS domain-containing sensor histidine kinase [Carboxylicivirga sp.]